MLVGYFYVIKLEMRVLAVGFILCILAMAIFVYGIYVLNPGDPLTGSAFAIVGIFLGMAALLILFSQFHHAMWS